MRWYSAHCSVLSAYYFLLDQVAQVDGCSASNQRRLLGQKQSKPLGSYRGMTVPRHFTTEFTELTGCQHFVRHEPHHELTSLALNLILFPSTTTITTTTTITVYRLENLMDSNTGSRYSYNFAPTYQPLQPSGFANANGPAPTAQGADNIGEFLCLCLTPLSAFV
jgi:hypothetical protein